MARIPASIARMPSLLINRQNAATIQRTNLDLFRLNEQLATGRQINRPSDDAIKTSAILLLNKTIDQRDQRVRNLDHADNALTLLDQALTEASDLVISAKGLASEQIGFGSTADERRNQAIVVESMIDELFALSNRESIAGFLFGGGRADAPPVESLLGGYRYLGNETGLTTDIGLGGTVPITLGGGNAIGSTSSRHVGTVQLNPQLTPETRLVDLDGARGIGVDPGIITFSVDGATEQQVDLTGSDTIGDVIDRVEAALRQYETDTGMTILGPNGVTVAGNALSLDMSTAAPTTTVAFSDLATAGSAIDLGLAGETGPMTFTQGSNLGFSAEPKLTARTTIASIPSLNLGQLQLSNLGRSVSVDLSTATSFQDIVNAVESAGLGISVEIDGENNRLELRNEVAAGKNQALSVAEVFGNNGTAQQLGIRTLNRDTTLDVFNDGRGVSIVTGQADPERNTDFTIALGNGMTVNVDLRPEDTLNVGTIIDRINAAAAAQLPAQGGAATDLQAGLVDGQNGIALRQGAPLGALGPIEITRENNSLAAGDLGFLTGSYDPASATFTAEDRAKVRVDNLFTALIDLRDSLEADDQFGIEIASTKIDGFTDRLSRTQALVGGYAQRVQTATRLEEDKDVIDQTTRSSLQDLDFVDATTQFSLLQTQLQAGLQATASLNQLSLLDFLG